MKATSLIADVRQAGSAAMTAPRIQLRAHPLRLTLDELNALHDEWKFNCGPASLCAVTGLTPAELRPHMLDFERKGYTNPTLMFAVLRAIGIPFEVHKEQRTDVPTHAVPWPSFGLCRIQWGGPWMKKDVPERARYRHTHWVATCDALGGSVGRGVFDINAVGDGCSGWIALDEWHSKLVPWLIEEAVPKGDGTWSIAHAVELANDFERGLVAERVRKGGSP